LTADVLVKTGDSNTGGRLTLELVYRGHLITGQTDIAVNSKHSALWVYNPPQGKAGFAVITDADLQAGTIMIILDTSTSMIVKKDGSPTDKYFKAVAALERVLSG